MAKYKDIGGTTVGFRSGSEEYTYPSGFEGSIYYNSSNGQFEFVGLGWKDPDRDVVRQRGTKAKMNVSTENIQFVD